MTVALVALGAALGAPVRYVTAHVLDGSRRRDLPDGSDAGSGLPWGTVLVNVVGSFLLGLFSGLGLSGDTIAFLGTGFCGGLTTYSALAVQLHDLGPRKGAVTVLATAVPALGLCFAGFWLGAR